MIGSTSKAFTTTGIAMLVDENKVRFRCVLWPHFPLALQLNWDKKASTYLPNLVLQDPFANSVRFLFFFDINLCCRKSLCVTCARTALACRVSIWSIVMSSSRSHSAPNRLRLAVQRTLALSGWKTCATFRQTFLSEQNGRRAWALIVLFTFSLQYNNYFYSAAGRAIETASGLRCVRCGGSLLKACLQMGGLHTNSHFRPTWHAQHHRGHPESHSLWQLRVPIRSFCWQNSAAAAQHQRSYSACRSCRSDLIEVHVCVCTLC